MDDLSEFSSSITEFKSSSIQSKQSNLVNSCSETDAAPVQSDALVETNPKSSIEIQTQPFNGMESNSVDAKKLSAFLRKVSPMIETELQKGPTPILDNVHTANAKNQIYQTYQKIVVPSIENSQGLATWLAVHTNNAPVLAVTTVAPHDDWCEHVNQHITLFIPKRMRTGNFVVFSDMRTIPLKACLRTLITNQFNKNIFAGSTVSGDICVWRYMVNSSVNNIDAEQLFCESSPHGCAISMDWATENRLITCHSNGWAIIWLTGKQMQVEKSFYISLSNVSQELSSILALNISDFIVGTKDGSIFHCSSINQNALKTNIEITSLKKHLFMVSTLMKREFAGHTIVISADLSGQVYYHDIRNSEEDTANVIIQIPLPFKNAITCSPDGNTIFCPGNDGALECYSIESGDHIIIKGALQGKGNRIKSSESGLWLVTGLYGDEFQIFYGEQM